MVLDQCGNRDGRVANPRLRKQRDVLEERFDLAGGDLLDHGFRLARLTSLLFGDALLAFDLLGRHAVAINRQRGRGGDVLGDELHELLRRLMRGDFRRGSGHLHQRRELAVVVAIHADHAVLAGIEARDVLDVHGLTGLRRRDLHELGHRLRRIGRERLGEETLDISRLGMHALRDELRDDFAEIFVARDEVRLARHFDQHAGAAVGEDLAADDAFARRAVGTLLGLGDALLTEVLDGGVHIAPILLECLLAIHHAGAGALAEFRNSLRGDHRGHLRALYVRSVSIGDAMVLRTMPSYCVRTPPVLSRRRRGAAVEA